MRQELYVSALANVLPTEGESGQQVIGVPRRDEKNRGVIPESKTTILAMEFRDGIMCAADRQVTYGYTSEPLDCEKIARVGPHTFMLGSGYSSSITLVENFLERTNRMFLESTGYLLTLRGQANVLSHWWLGTETALGYYLGFHGILAGFDHEADFSLYDLSGGSYEQRNQFAVGGSGSAQALGVLDQQYQPGMTRKQALRVANEAIMQAGHRDVFSSHVWVAIPSIAVISEDATERLGNKEIIPSLAEILRKRPGVHHELAEALLADRLKEVPDANKE